MPKIYDCFIFFNELDLLELRLAELYDHVDYFVLVEAKTAYSGQKKPLHYAQNKKRFAQWNDKIIHVVAELPKLNLIDRMLIRLSEIGPLYRVTSKITAFGFGRWKLEHSLRNQIMKGLQDAAPDDIIMISDVDEIPRASKIKQAVKLARKKLVGLHQVMYYYYLNGRTKIQWVGTKICTLDFMNKRYRGSPQELRVPIREIIMIRLFKRKYEIHVVKSAGWHFSYMGGVKRVIAKKETGSHAEIGKGADVAAAAVRKDMDEGVFRYKGMEYKVFYRPLDKSFPKWLLAHKQRFAHLIR